MCTQNKKYEERRYMKTNKTLNKTNNKISKGYRLKHSTHRMIKKIQVILNNTQDKVISSAIRSYYIQIKKNNEFLRINNKGD